MSRSSAPKILKMGQNVQVLDDASQRHRGNPDRFYFLASGYQHAIGPRERHSSKTAPDTLRTSQFARARIIWRVHEGPVIPVLAVQRINGQIFAFVVEAAANPKSLHQKVVSLGEMTGNDYTVLDGLKNQAIVSWSKAARIW